MAIGYWVLMGAIALIGICIAWAFFTDGHMVGGGATILVTVVVLIVMFILGMWYYNNTASGIRAIKDQQSNLNNGIEREITITAEDGREIYYYHGKCDIETNDSYILFEDEDGNRQMIYWGITDTIIISEVGD